MTIIKINEETEKGKSLIKVLEQFKDQKEIIEFLSEIELEEIEDSFMAQEIDESRKYGYTPEEDIIKILSTK